MEYDVIIVGGGIAGLTAAAFLSKEGYKVVLCEKENKIGGLVNSFEFKGFTFDGGIRAIENSGIVYPMLAQLGLSVEFLKNDVSIGIENDAITVVSKESLMDYQELLIKKFPDNKKDIESIIKEIKKIMQYMDILYGIDNPVFFDLKKDREYLMHTLLPWLFKYIMTISKILKLQMPVDEYLKGFSKNQVLIDMIVQHFFKKTPAFFALSYFSLYLDYKYPKGGTGAMTSKMEEFILEHHGEIRKETEIVHVDPNARLVIDKKGNTINYKKMIWTSDLKLLYNIIDLKSLQDDKIKKRILERKEELADKIGGDSILTTYVTLDIDKSYFEKICSPHFFYTPVKEGLSNCPLTDLQIQETSDDSNHFGERTSPEKEGNPGFIYVKDKETVMNWARKFFNLTTYEISCPVMRDSTLAPEGMTGLIISTLMEYSLVRYISEMGWYEEFKSISHECIISVLDSTIFPGIKEHVIDQFVSTPLTLEKMTGNSDGAITGWAFTNKFIPAVSSIPKVAQSIMTPIPDVYQAGQWTYSPAGFPISIMTAKLAVDKVNKDLAKSKREADNEK